VTPREDVRLSDTLRRAYAVMREDEATTLSPFLSTSLGGQQPAAFDALIAEPPATSPVGVIFLHGYGGNFAMQCWLVARPALRIGAVTLCPSTGVRGDWWTESGERILRQSIEELHRRGVERIYLAGLSNGGVGACRLAPKLQAQLAGMILISGADPDVPPPALPVLVIHGAQDERMPLPVLQQYAAATGPNGSAYIVEGDHFVLLKQAEALQQVIADWLVRQEGA
jgi:pimeloyl-ACP methyl ester carboxylesterase